MSLSLFHNYWIRGMNRVRNLIVERANDPESLVDLTVVLWFSGTPLRAILGRILGVLGINPLVQPLVFAITYIPLIGYVVKTKRLDRAVPFVVLLGFTCLYFGITLLMHPDYWQWYSRDTYGIWYTIFSPARGAIWAFLMVCLPKDKNRLVRDVLIVGWLWAVYVLFMTFRATAHGGLWEFIDVRGNVSQRAYSVDFGYSAAFCAITLLTGSVFLPQRNLYMRIIQIIIGIGSVLSAAIYGSRGSLLCISAWVVLSIVLRACKNLRSRLIALSCLLLSLIILLTSGILSLLAKIIQDVFGVESRTLQMLESNNFLADNGRNEITQMVIDAIRNSPLFGYGAYGDRPILGPTYNWGYSHNLFLELAVDFGVVGAVLICASILIESTYHLFCSHDKDTQCLVLIFFTSGLELLLSNTFWGCERFWALIGVLYISGLRKPWKAIYRQIKNNGQIIRQKK